MAKVDTNTVSLLYKREATPGTAEAVGTETHVATEPNEIGGFGATIDTTAREPISNRLQRQKGAVTNLAAAADFSADVTMAAMIGDGTLASADADNLHHGWIGAAIFAKWQNRDVRDIAVTAITGQNSFTHGGFAAAASGTQDFEKLPEKALIWGRGFANPANNGLRSVTTAAAGGGTTLISAAITTGGAGGQQAALANAAASNGVTHGRVSLAGYRITGAGNSTAWQFSSSTRLGTLTAAAADITAIKNGLRVGQMIHIGSVKTIGGDIQNGVGTGGQTAGFARYTGVSTTTTLVFDRVSPALQLTTAQNIAVNSFLDVVYGDFIKNVPTTDDLYDDATYTLALLSTDLFSDVDSSNPDGLEYAVGAKVGSLSLEFALNDKATFSASFVARDVEVPVKGNPGNQLEERANDAYSTVADFARLRMDVAGDDDGISTDFKSLTLTMDPQISPENVIGKLGARYVNRGNLQVTAEAEVIFADDLIPRALRENTTASFDAAIANDDGVLIFDVPSMTIGGGGRSYPANAAVTITGTGDAFEDDDHGASIMISQFYVPIPPGD